MSSDLARGVKIVSESTLFCAEWYSATYSDAARSGLSAAEHYFRNGGLLGHDPGPGFSTKGYLKKYPDVADARMNALYHYEMHGRSEGRTIVLVANDSPDTDPALIASRIDNDRKIWPEAKARAYVATVLSRKLTGEPLRLDQSFDAAGTRQFVDALISLTAEGEAAHVVKATVIMPSYNRADKIEAAIRSVLEQSHQNLELIVVDDGSSDDTADVLRKYETDPRVRLFWNSHGGVSAARNTGLDNATGEMIFYLDSDNIWSRDFVRLMLIGLQVSKADCAYGATRLQGPNGQLIGYRGEPFDWNACVNGNYIDMNVFCHRRDLTAEFGRFDTGLRRMVDWDLILRYTRERGASYIPVVGCIYLEDSADPTRITTSQPYIFRRIAQEKNRQGLTSSQEALKSIRFNIALKISAPSEERAAWGDYHYAESLKDALTALGHSVRIDFLGTWYDQPLTRDDLAIALRGLTEYTPRPGQLSLMWNISHPDQVGYDEYRAYHGIFVASRSYAALLSNVLGRDVQPLLQCSDTRRFGFSAHEPGPEDAGVFVGNSRNEYRKIVKWSVDSNLPVAVYGQGWEPFIPASMIKGQNIDNSELHKTYAAASFVLNDHWASMHDFGFVSNRVFDVLSCGGRLVSDHIPAISDLFGNAVICAKDEAEFSAAMAQGLPISSLQKRKEVAELVHRDHSFAVRAKEICTWLHNFLSAQTPAKDATPAAPTVSLRGAARRRVGLLLQPGRAWPTSSAFIRLIAPLTTDAANCKLEIIRLSGVDDPQLDTVDSCIVQRVAVARMADARHLIDRLTARNIPLFVDSDDAFFLVPAHVDQDRVLRHLMSAAREVWFSTETLASYYDEIRVPKRVIPNALDPRFWRNYRNPVTIKPSGAVVRFLYMGTSTHDGDFSLVYPAFEKLAQRFPDRFTLTFVGAVRQPPRQPWINQMVPPPDQGSYPMFARWLMSHSAFDVGIAPLEEGQFNRAKSDIKFLDYSAAGLLSLVSEAAPYDEALCRDLAIGCENNAQSWFQAMARIIRAPEKNLAMRERAMDYLWSERNTLVAENPVISILAQ